MDVLTILKQQHVEAHATFKRIGAAGPNNRGAMWGALKPQLELHEQVEERFVYDPVARDAGSTDPVLAHWEHEHEAQVRDADALMSGIDRLSPDSGHWLRMVEGLATTLDGHIAHEESDIWPRIRAAWNEEKLEHAGRQIDSAKAAVAAGASISEAIRGVTAE